MIKKTTFEGQTFAVLMVRTYVRWIDVELEDLVNMVIDLSDDVRSQRCMVYRIYNDSGFGPQVM